MAFNRAKWGAGGVAVRGRKVLVVFYTRNGKTWIKFPFGSQKHNAERNDTSPRDTVVNELVGDHEMMESGSIKIIKMFWSNPVTSDHTQFWFHVEPEGVVRTTELVDQEVGAPDEFVSAPFWRDILEVYKDPRTSYLHREMIPHFVQYRAKQDPEMGWVHREMGVDDLLSV